MRSDPGKELHEPAHLHRRVLPLIFAASLAVLACSTSASDASDASTEAAGDDAGGFVDGGSVFDLDASAVEKVRRTFGGCQGSEECHVGGAAGLTFPAGNELANVVGVASTERPDLLRVKPGSPFESYLYLKVVGDGGIDGGSMPPGGADPRLAVLLGAWIEAGAPPQ